jgi:type IV pilus assembly protein PilQ
MLKHFFRGVCFFLLFFPCALNAKILIKGSFSHVPTVVMAHVLSQVCHNNWIISKSYTGEFSEDLPALLCDEAIHYFLLSKNLSLWPLGSSTLLLPSKKWKLLKKKMERLPRPLSQKSFFIKNTDVSFILGEIQQQNKTLLSSRGRVWKISFSNEIWVEDTQEKIEKLSELIRKLDHPQKQVLIKAKIAFIDKHFEHALGFDFSVTQASKLRPFELDMDLQEDKEEQGSPLSNVAIFKFSDARWLSLSLLALEKAGHGRVISSPSIVTSNNHEATIASGEEIPYQYSTGHLGETSIDFKQANLSLTIRPTIFLKDTLSLHIEVRQDKPTHRFVKGVPTISTRRMVTDVVMKSHEMLVLGGIYEENKGEMVTKIPILGDIPMIGRFFTYKKRFNQGQELMIFVTPEIFE